jgi:uncharacterized protein
MERQAASRGLLVFGALAFVGTAAVQALLITSGKPVEEQALLILTLMWVPGAASVITRIVLREGFGDVSFRLPCRTNLGAVALAWLYPIPIGIVAYGLAWGLRLAPFSAPPLTKLGLDFGSDTAHLIARIVQSVILLTPISLVSAFGEELGWRGYLVPRLVQFGVRRPLLVSGIIWGLWHVPLILTGQYIHGPIPWLASLVFLASVTADAFLLGWMRLRTGSVWPAAIGHASWNAIIQGAFDRSTPSPSIWVGEGGVLTMAATVILVAIVLRIARQRPGIEPLERFA